MKPMKLRTRSYSLLRDWPAWLTLVVGLAASGGLGLRLHRQAVELDRLRLQRIAEVVLDRLRTKVQTTDLILRQAQDYFGSQENITENMFREWCRKYGWSATAPWMHGLALYTNLNAGRWRAVVPPDPATWTEADFRAFKNSAERTTVRLKPAFVYSHDASKRWPAHFGTEVRFENRYQGIIGAIPANSPHTSDRQVVMERDGGNPYYGATVSVPIYETQRDELRAAATEGPPPRTPAHTYNWNLCRGALLAPIDYTILESLIWSRDPKEVGVEIYSSALPRPESWLNETNHLPRALDPAFKPYLSVNLPWKLYNGHWSLFVYTLPAFEAGSPRYMARLTFVAGASMTLLATALVGFGLRARTRQERMTEQVREARDALAAAQQERQKLSHDLHDNTIQALYAIQLGLNHTAQEIEVEPAKSRRALCAVRGELDTVIAEIRRFITAEESSVNNVDFAGVLNALVDRSRTGTTAQIDVSCDPGAADRLSPAQAVQLANIAREALSNSLRHARPHRVQIALRAEPRFVFLEVSDDGIGFEPRSQTHGIGLASMTKRTLEMGGTLDIQSSPGKGTRIIIRIPASPAEWAEAQWSDKS